MKNIVLLIAMMIAGVLLAIATQKGVEFFYQQERIEVTDTAEHFEGIKQNVILYGTQWCPVCHSARDMLTNNQIDFYDVDIESTSVERLALYHTTESNSVPVLIIGSTIVRGFNAAKVLKILQDNEMLSLNQS